MYIAKESLIDHVASEKQSFFAAKVEGLKPEVEAKIVQFELDKIAIRKYLALLATSVNNPNVNVNEMEVPLCLQDAAPKESPPKKKVTARASKKKSPTKQRKTKASSSTSQAKPESNG